MIKALVLKEAEAMARKEAQVTSTFLPWSRGCALNPV